MKPEFLFGGGGGGGGGSRNIPDNLRSTDSFEALIGVVSGPIKGLTAGGLRNLFVNGVAVEDSNGKSTLTDFSAELFTGDPSVLRPIKLALGGSSGPTQVNQNVNNDTDGRQPGEWRYASVQQSGCDFIDLRFVVQSLYLRDKKGTKNATATLEIELQATGMTTWYNPLASSAAPAYNPNGIEFGPLLIGYLQSKLWAGGNGSTTWASSGGRLSITGKTTSPYVKELRIAVPNTGAWAGKTWQVRVRLIERDEYNNGDDDNPKEEYRKVGWESIAGVKTAAIGDDEAWRGLAYLRILGKASDQITGVPEIYGIYDLAMPKCPPASVWNAETRVFTGAAWDGATYQVGWTQCPAWLISNFIEDDLSGVSALAPGSRLNKWDTLEASKWFAERVPDGKGGTQPRYSLNYLFDQALDVDEAVNYLAGAVNAFAWDQGDGDWRMVVEKPENPVAIFTEENIVGEFAYSHTDVDSRFNDLTGIFLDEERGFEETRVRVYDQDDIDLNGRRPTTITLVGCTNRQEAIRRLYLRLLSSLRETKVVTYTTNRQGRMLKQFSVVGVADGSLGDAAKKTTGRIFGVSSDRRTITLRDPMRLELGVSYKLALTLPNPSYSPEPTSQPMVATWNQPTIVREFAVTNPASRRGDVYQIELDQVLPANTPENANISLVANGLPAIPKQYRVLGLNVSDENPEFVTVSAMEVFTSKWALSDGITEDSINTQVPDRFVNAPIAPSDGKVLRLDNVATGNIQRIVLQAAWQRPSGSMIDGYQINYSFNSGPMMGPAFTRELNFEVPDPSPGDWYFEIRTVDRRGIVSDPLTANIEVTASDLADLLLEWQNIVGPGKPQDGATVGAPPGTSVGDVPVEELVAGFDNFNNRNDRDASPVLDPRFVRGSDISHVRNKDGTVALTIAWDWTGVNDSIDGFIIGVQQDVPPAMANGSVRNSTGGQIIGQLGRTINQQLNPVGSSIALGMVEYTVPAEKRKLVIPSVSATGTYKVTVTAYRRVDPDINPKRIIYSNGVAAPSAPYQPETRVIISAEAALGDADRLVGDMVRSIDRARYDANLIRDVVSGVRSDVDSQYSWVRNDLDVRVQAARSDLNAVRKVTQTLEEEVAGFAAVREEQTALVTDVEALTNRTSVVEASYSFDKSQILPFDFSGTTDRWGFFLPGDGTTITFGDHSNSTDWTKHPGVLAEWNSVANNSTTIFFPRKEDKKAQFVPVQAGSTYRITASVGLVSGRSRPKLYCEARARDTSTIGEAPSKVPLGCTNNELLEIGKWTSLTIELTIEPGTAFLFPCILLQGGQGVIRSMKIQDVSTTERTLSKFEESVTALSDAVSSSVESTQKLEAQMAGTQDSQLAANIRDEVSARAKAIGAVSERFQSIEAWQAAAPKIYYARAVGNSAYGTKPFAGIGLADQDGKMIVNATISYTVITFDGLSRVKESRTFDVYNDATMAGQMAAYLNAIPKGDGVVVITADEPRNNRTNAGLQAAMERCGAGDVFAYGDGTAKVPNFRLGSAYVLVGRAGVGRGSGQEFYRGAANNDPDAWIDQRFDLLGGKPVSGSIKSVMARVSASEIAIVDGDKALADRLDVVESQFAGTRDSTLRSSFNLQITALTKADEAFTSKFESIESQFRGATGSELLSKINNNYDTLVREDQALAARQQVVEATIGNALNVNGKFQAQPYVSGVPYGWSDWAWGFQITKSDQPGRNGTIPIKIVRAGVQDIGIRQTIENVPAGWYVVEVEAQKFGGNWQGAGVYVNFPGSTEQRISFGAVADTSEMIYAGADYNRRTWSVLVNNPRQANCILYLQAGFSAFGLDGTTADFHFHSCFIRPATAGEIEARKAGSSLSDLSSRVTTTERAIATTDGKLTAYWQVDANAGGSRAQLRIWADKNAGGGVDITGDVRIGGNLLVDGTVSSTKVQNGLTNVSTWEFPDYNSFGPAAQIADTGTIRLGDDMGGKAIFTIQMLQESTFDWDAYTFIETYVTIDGVETKWRTHRQGIQTSGGNTIYVLPLSYSITLDTSRPVRVRVVARARNMVDTANRQLWMRAIRIDAFRVAR